MLPALREAWREFRSGFGSGPISIFEGKTAGLSFDTVNVDWYARNGYRGIYAALSGGLPAWSGETVSADSALNHSVVWACKRIISESVAFLPLLMMQSRAGGKYPADHPLQQLLHNAPNDEMTAMSFRETLTGHVVMLGNAYAHIIRRSGTGVAVELWPLLPSMVRIDRDANKQLVYLIKEGNDSEKTYTIQRGKPQDILHIRGIGNDGVQGYSVVTVARQSFGTSLSAERYAAKFYANGGRVPYVLKMPGRFKTDEEFRKFRGDWETTYSEPHKAPILESGLEYQQIGLSAADAQFLETRQFNIPEICRWFLISPHLVGDLSRATFSNIEQLALEFVKMTLTAWITRWEQDLWRCLLTPEEKAKNYFFKHNLNGLLRGDFVSRMQGYASALQNGHLSINEVRDREDLNAIDGGDDHHIQLNMQTLPGGTPTASQSATLMKVGAAKPQDTQL